MGIYVKVVGANVCITGDYESPLLFYPVVIYGLFNVIRAGAVGEGRSDESADADVFGMNDVILDRFFVCKQAV